MCCRCSYPAHYLSTLGTWWRWEGRREANTAWVVQPPHAARPLTYSSQSTVSSPEMSNTCGEWVAPGKQRQGAQWMEVWQSTASGWAAQALRGPLEAEPQVWGKEHSHVREAAVNPIAAIRLWLSQASRQKGLRKIQPQTELSLSQSNLLTIRPSFSDHSVEEAASGPATLLLLHWQCPISGIWVRHGRAASPHTRCHS